MSKDALAFGGSADLKIGGGAALDTFSVGASYSSGPVFAALTTSKLSSATLSAKYKLSDSLQVSCEGAFGCTGGLC